MVNEPSFAACFLLIVFAYLCAMSLLPDSLEDYLAEHYSQEPPILMAINQQTYLEQSAPHMLSGKVQGRFLSMISRLMQPQSILELGTFTGYSAICLAEGLANGGKLTTIERKTQRMPSLAVLIFRKPA